MLIPAPGSSLEIPKWNGNEFLNDDGSRPLIRTFTPRFFDAQALTLEIDVVLHEGGAVSGWAETAADGDGAAVSGTGRGYTIDPAATRYVLVGDETALPAISQLMEAIPSEAALQVIVEVRSEAARLPLPTRSDLAESWVVADSGPGSAMLPALRMASIAPGTKVWAAGEAATMYQVRKHLFEERGLDRGDATVQGYWKRR